MQKTQFIPQKKPKKQLIQKSRFLGVIFARLRWFPEAALSARLVIHR
jgi:hypothetical protein